MRRGILVALSGVDCAGKSTQRDHLMTVLRAAGHVPLNVYARAGYTPGLKAVKAKLGSLAGRRRSSPKEMSGKPSRFPRRAASLRNPVKRWFWLTIALLGLIWLFCVRIPFARSRGRAVVSNRYLLDSIVDFRVNFPDDRVEEWLLFRLLRRFAVRVIETARRLRWSLVQRLSSTGNKRLALLVSEGAYV